MDKRRFTTEGEAREQGREDTGENARGVSNSPTASPGVADRKPVEKDRTENDRSREASGGGPDKIDFASFVVSMGTQALIALGEIPNPETRVATVNREAAQQMIDILGLLEEKTKGNLTVEEAHLLQEVLSSLRLMFVRKAK